MVSSTLTNEKVALCRFALPIGVGGEAGPRPGRAPHTRGRVRPWVTSRTWLPLTHAGGSDTDLSDPPASAEVLTRERGCHLGSFHTMLLKRAVPP